jgi:hypothetical protein
MEVLRVRISRGGWFLGLILSVSACHGRVSTSPAELQKYRNIAVIARIDGAPSSEVGTGDGALAKTLTTSMTRFVVGRRFEGGVTAQLPTGLFQIANPTRVAEELELLLVEKGDSDLDYEKLRKLNVDAVLEIHVNSYGLRRGAQRQVGGFSRGYAQMVTLSGSTVWRLPFDLDESANGSASVDEAMLAKDVHYAWQQTVDRLAYAVGSLIARDLGARQERSAPRDAPAPDPGQSDAQ